MQALAKASMRGKSEKERELYLPKEALGSEGRSVCGPEFEMGEAAVT